MVRVVTLQVTGLLLSAVVVVVAIARHPRQEALLIIAFAPWLHRSRRPSFLSVVDRNSMQPQVLAPLYRVYIITHTPARVYTVKFQRYGMQ